MKRVDAIFSREATSAVASALIRNGFHNMTVWESLERRDLGAIRKMWRGREYEENIRKGAYLAMIVNDEDAKKVANVIAENASTEKSGGGIVSISPVDEVIVIREK